MSVFENVMNIIRNGSEQDFRAIVSSEVLFALSKALSPVEFQDVIIAKNIRIYGDVNLYIKSFVDQTVAGLARMAEGPAKNATKRGQTAFIEKLLARTDISEESRRLLESARVDLSTAAAAAAGGKRRRSAKKTLRHRKRRTVKGSRKH
jgi:predicted short-subunit dehydrogenase-like oxidoreductase (DUF2520 family)